ncbi:MAG: signal peptidase II [candidate division KSB1 bacterium]|nr:signal peptidase II [candidate division KSB1 bacterium]
MHFLTSLRGMGVLLFTVAIVILDQITKLVVKSRFYYGESIEIFGDLLRLTYIQNEGMAFGIRFGGKLFFTIFASLASVIILVYLYRMRHERFFPRLSLALILGGAIGNLIDRFAYGAVVDFIDVGIGSTRWPVFNIADSGVTVGMIILIFIVLFEKEKQEPKPASPFFSAQEPAPSDENDKWRDARRPR